MPNGFILVNKEVGITSFNLVNKIKKITNTNKSGHNGTLDISASGLMLVGLGNACKLFKKLENHNKTYVTTIKFGILTDTLDLAGVIEDRKEVKIKDLNKALEKLKQQEYQIPPLVSSIKVNGLKLMDYKRKNIDIKLTPRKTKLLEYKILDYKENDELKLEVKVEKGYYIRSLARDLGELLNTYGVVKDLKRIKIENLKIEDSYTLEDIKKNNYKLLNIDEVYPLKKIDIKNFEKQVLNGAKIDKDKINTKEEEFYFTKDNKIISIYKLNKETNKYEQEVYLNGN